MIPYMRACPRIKADLCLTIIRWIYRKLGQPADADDTESPQPKIRPHSLVLDSSLGPGGNTWVGSTVWIQEALEEGYQTTAANIWIRGAL